MTDPDAEVWRHTFEPGPDFTLEVRGLIVGRVLRNDTMPASATARWFWTIPVCARSSAFRSRASRPKVPKLAAPMDEAEPDLLASIGCPTLAV